MDASRTVLLVVFDGLQSLDLTGPLEVFAGADRTAGARRHGGYRTVVAANRPGPLRTTSGLQLCADTALRAVREPVDTLLVVGGEGVHAARRDRATVTQVRRLAAGARRVASVCTGAFLLAEAGLLDGRTATTHWAHADALAREYPAVRVDPEPIFRHDGNVTTSAGVTAGMDLALALVEDDLGPEVALEVAQHLVLFVRRPGSQAQFSAPMRSQVADRDEVRSLQHWIVEHPGRDCSIEALAQRSGFSPRHLARLFAEQTGTTPARFVADVRLETARRRLTESADPVDRIADTCGFGTSETMRRAFVRALGMPPTEYRRRFRRGA